MDLVAGHVNPDFDCFASMVAARKLYPEARMAYLGSQNRNIREFYSLHADVLDFSDLRSLDQTEITRLIMVDTRVPERLGELSGLALRKGVTVFTFDHHPETDEDVKATRDFSRPTGATTTIMVELIRQRQLALTPLEATLLALGIHEDTGSLTYPTTTAEDAEALAYLMGSGANINVIDHFLSRGLLTDQLAGLLDEFAASARHVEVHGVDVVIARGKVTEYVDGAAMLPHRLAATLGVEVVFALVEMADRVQVIARSKAAEVNVGEILAVFEGGGHRQAASAKVKQGKVDEVEEKLIDELKLHVTRPLMAGQIMSRPVRTIDETVKIAEANEIMARYGYEGLPVMSEGALVGMIGRRDVDKAVHHGLAHAPVKGFMSRKIVTITARQPVHDIQALLSDESISRLPVIEQGRIAGIVTRTDLLRAMHGSDYLGGAGGVTREERFDRRHILRLIDSIFPDDVLGLLEAISEEGRRMDVRAYLVGGAVRDLLLGTANLDIDVVIEGDGIAFARGLVKSLGGRVRAHKKFGTAVVVLPGDFYVDIASARTEFYEHPAALPEVERSSIRQDLARRDFSINAMAIGIDMSHRGELLDFFGGLRDLRRKHVKVLHNLSFVEDPTRIFRAVRFEQRCAFRMDEHTEGLAKRAIDMGMVGELSDVRVREELVAILSEETAFAALRRLEELGALKGLHRKLVVDDGLRSVFAQVDRVLMELDVYFASRPRRWMVLLMAMLVHLRRSELTTWGARMRLRKGDVALLVQGVTEVPKVLARLASSRKLADSKLYFLLHDLRPESLVFAHAVAETEVQRARVEHFLTELKGVKPHLGGKDLVRLGLPPGPHFGEILQALQVAKLDGVLPSKHDEEVFVRERIELSRNP